MFIYFIRHGETEFNRNGIHQHHDVPLSVLGKKQVEKTGKRLKDFPITKLLSSDLRRAYESAEIIAPHLGLSIEPNELFREVKSPSDLYGHKHVSPKTLIVGTTILRHLHDPSWHLSDEENLFDVKKRVAESVAFLKRINHGHEHVAVVSHAFIINLFLKYMCFHKEVRARDYLRTLIAAKMLGNGSISTVTFSDDDNPLTCDWMCLKINDREHLK